MDNIRNLHEEYTSKLDKLLKDYIELYKQGYEWVSHNFSYVVLQLM